MLGESKKISRRDALKGISILSVSAALILIAGSKIRSGSATNKKNPTYIETKAVYFGMSVQMTGVKEEYFKLETPAHLQSLLSQIQSKHEVFVTMLPTMQIVIDGNPSTPQDNPILQNNSEVDFIPVFVGG